MPSPRIIKNDDISHRETLPGVTVAAYVTKEAGATEISSGITTFCPGRSNTTHYHDAEESVIVIQGEGFLVINGQEIRVTANDAAFITPGTHHRLINTCDEPFRIAWSYASVDVSRTPVED